MVKRKIGEALMVIGTILFIIVVILLMNYLDYLKWSAILN